MEINDTILNRIIEKLPIQDQRYIQSYGIEKWFETLRGTQSGFSTNYIGTDRTPESRVGNQSSIAGLGPPKSVNLVGGWSPSVFGSGD